MNVLVDTNVLVRLREAHSLARPDCDRALRCLRQAGHVLHICTQVAIEYWVVITRPREVNGLGLTTEEAESDLQKFEQLFVWLAEPADVGRRWRALVNKHKVRGRQAHDARLAAFMNAHGLTTILTLNAADFARYDGITCLLPSDVK